jgi:hypothetical protein
MGSKGNFECICGFVGQSGHAGKCDVYLTEVNRVRKNLVEYIADYYKKTYSITECCKYAVEKEKSHIKHTSLRVIITKHLDLLGIRESFGDLNFHTHRQHKLENVMMNKYGVINNGQRAGAGFKLLNSIPYVKLALDEEYSKFREQVRLATRRIRWIDGEVSPKCYYTGITFNDELLDKVNPNDPFKRTIDHKVSVTEAFFRGWTVEQTVAKDNLVFCLRVVNTTKGNTTEKDFRKLILPVLKKRLEHENK